MTTLPPTKKPVSYPRPSNEKLERQLSRVHITPNPRRTEPVRETKEPVTLAMIEARERQARMQDRKGKKSAEDELRERVELWLTGVFGDGV
ncbi:hypothetical protein TWF481_011084 [Arthrobotrys musiformis]|uniref:Uncharacterized protein n=1 Tax=Arthrobotrys musiformis TaxID=47236 RepID=A0AAV9VZ65_9PEZI